MQQVHSRALIVETSLAVSTVYEKWAAANGIGVNASITQVTAFKLGLGLTPHVMQEELILEFASFFAFIQEGRKVFSISTRQGYETIILDAKTSVASSLLSCKTHHKL